MPIFSFSTQAGVEILSHFSMTEFLFFSSLRLSPAPPCPVWLVLSVVMTHSRILAHSHSSPHSMCLSCVLLTGSVACVQFVSSPLVSAHISEFWVTVLSWTSLWNETELCPYSDLFPQGGSQVFRSTVVSIYRVNIQGLKQRKETLRTVSDGASLGKRRMAYKISCSSRTARSPQ